MGIFGVLKFNNVPHGLEEIIIMNLCRIVFSWEQKRLMMLQKRQQSLRRLYTCTQHFENIIQININFCLQQHRND